MNELIKPRSPSDWYNFLYEYADEHGHITRDKAAKLSRDLADYERRIRAALEAVSPAPGEPPKGWKDISTAPKGGSVLLDLGETVPDVPDVRVGCYVSEEQGREMGEDLSAAGGWVIWNSGNDWFVVPFADAHGWAPLPSPSPGSAE